MIARSILASESWMDVVVAFAIAMPGMHDKHAAIVQVRMAMCCLERGIGNVSDQSIVMLPG